MSETQARWRGFSHEELYRMLHEGPGATSSATPSRRWAELTSALDEVGHQLDTALGAMSQGWVGRAAGAAHGRLQPLAGWARTSSESAASMRVAVENQGDHIARARADMPVPEGVTPMAPDPSAPPAVQVVAVQTDAEPTETARATGEQRAIEVMTAYETSTKQNLAALVPFEPPGEVLRVNGVRRGRGRGVRFGADVAVGGVDAPGRDGSSDQHRPGPRGHGNPHVETTGSSASAATAPAPPRPLPALAPGMSAGAVPMEHIGPGPVALGAPRGSDKVRERRVAAPGHALGAAGPVDAHSSSGAHGAVPPATPPPHAAGTPVGASGAAPVSTADKLAARRFGTEAIGSSQWFADAADSAPPRSVSGRNRDLGSTEHVTENVTVDGEDHHLPPPVIGG